MCSKFHYPKDKNDLENVLARFKLQSGEAENDLSTDSYGENIKTDPLIVMANVSGLADKSNEFASFLTVARRFKHNCVYIFHMIYSEKSIWKLILLQTNIFSIFPGSIQQSSVLKVLQANCVRERFVYLLQNLLWINRLFVDLANKNERVCLTLDCRRPGKV